MTLEAQKMLAILEMTENNRLEKKHFIHAGVYNPGRAKSQLVNKHDRCILCKRENNTSYRMYITNPFVARKNMSEKDRKKYVIEHLYNLYSR